MDRETAKRKIAALLKMTERSGCTEAEALAAAEKAAALMREYQVSEAEAETTTAEIKVATQGQSMRDNLWSIVAFCTNTAPVFDLSVDGNKLAYVGQEPGPQIATYLHELLNRAIDNELSAFKAGDFYRRRRSLATRRAASRDFVAGLVGRLSRRLVDLFKASIDKSASVKAVVARDALYGDGLSSVPDRKQCDVRFGEATYAGWQAGDNVDISHGVTGREAPSKIEARP